MSQVIRVLVRRMTTSREDETKYEHFVVAVNARGQSMDYWMRYNPVEALFLATDLADFLGLEVEPLIIDGERVKLGEIEELMRRYKNDAI